MIFSTYLLIPSTVYQIAIYDSLCNSVIVLTVAMSMTITLVESVSFTSFLAVVLINHGVRLLAQFFVIAYEGVIINIITSPLPSSSMNFLSFSFLPKLVFSSF